MNTEKLVTAIFLHANEGIIVSDAEGKIVFINQAILNLFGYEKQELIGQKVETLIPKRFIHNHEKHRQNYNQNPHARSMGAELALMGQKKDGSEFPVEVSLSPFKEEKQQFIVAFIIDITKRKQAEERLRTHKEELEKQVQDRTLILREAITTLEKTKDELNIALRKERELNDMKSRFVSMASHEFRTPLATILSSLALVEKYIELNNEEKRLKHTARIKSAVNNMTDILNDFLSLSKLEEGKINYLASEFNLKSFSVEASQEMQSVCKEGQQIKFSYTGDDIDVKSDKKILKNIYLNLLSNAIKFSPEKSEIDFKINVDPKLVTISIADKGIGISEEDQQHLFERFFRGQNATNIQGTGLGLNIVLKYIELLKAKIKCTSELNYGTTFTIIFQRKNLI